MRGILTLLFAAALLLLTTAITEPWPETDRKLWPVGGVAACTDDFCDCPAASAALLCHDFEEGQSDCALAKAYGSLNALGEIGYVIGAPDCADASDPIDGTYSYSAPLDGDADSLTWWPLDASGGTNICANNEDCILTAYLNIFDDDDGAVGNSVGFSSVADVILCSIAYRGSTNTLRASCAADVKVVSNPTNDVVYKVCLQYTDADDCTVAIDPENGTWCAGVTGTQTVLDCNGGSHVAVSYLTFGDINNHATVKMDNVMVVAE